MEFPSSRDKENVVVPVRTEAHPSSNLQPGQSNTRTTLDTGNHELVMARYLMDDLADHVFGRIVSTELARDILRQFIDDGFVQVFKQSTPRYNHNLEALDPSVEDVQRAIEQAFKDADMHDCIRPGTDRSESSPEDTKGKGNSEGREKKNQATYSFKWSTFPTEPIDEDELVNFLNEIIDRAFDVAQSKLVNAAPKLNHRFTARTDKNHAMPLSYEPDGEDMRHDFLLLPVQAFLDDFKTVGPRYLNFTATRLVGEAKNKDLAAGVEQVQRYARGSKRAQPWVHYVLAMAITRDKAVFMRGEGSGTKRLELILADCRGCIEFIRILLGLALAGDVDLGQNPDVELKNETRSCQVINIIHRSVASNIPSSATASRAAKTTHAAESVGVSPSDVPDAASDALPISSRTRSASAASNRSAS
ncbi:hypothetical protein EV363DRAFT_1105842, partial [Boletus edulis]